MDESHLSASLDSLPFEIIEYIFSCDVISFVDLCRLSSVCQVFSCIGRTNKLWRDKYEKKWPELYHLYNVPNTDWKTEFRIRHEYGKMVSRKLADMSVEFYHQDNVSNDAFVQYRDTLGNHPLAHNILIDELEFIIHGGNSNENLTNIYYAKRTLRYMRHNYLQTVWRDHLSLPPNKQPLEIGACLLAQWCQPTRVNCTKHVISELNDIANRVRVKLAEDYPLHPALKQSLIQPAEVLSESLWSPSQCRIILMCINAVMFHEMKFFGNKTDFYCPENTFIDKVMSRRTGIPITLGIVYASIAARLGVACLPVNFPGHFLLKWLEHPHLIEKEAYTFIDVFEGGAFKVWNELYDLVPGYQQLSDSWFEVVTPVKIFVRMCWNLVEVGRHLDGVGEGLLCLCNALELLSILNPDDMEHKLLLARVYLHLCINMSEVIALLQEIADQDPTSTGIVGYMYQTALTQVEVQKVRRNTIKTKVQLREGTTDVNFAVGMIMRHKKYSYRCVIYGWDSTCTASKDWIKQMGVHNLPKKDKQPFYHVLVDDGTNRYAAQENLEADYEEQTISHIEVGRYFESFHKNYYEPNEQKLNEYPQDNEARIEILKSIQTESRPSI